MQRFFVNGRPVEQRDFVVEGDDPGLIVGLNAFETMRTYKGKLFRAGRHIDRLIASAATVGVPCPDRESLAVEMQAAIDGLDGEWTVRTTLTPRRRLTVVRPLDRSIVCAPLRVVTRRWEPTAWVPGHVKHGSRIVSEVARRLADADEVFWVGHDGCLTEATRSSIFAVVDDTIVTPPCDGRILDGVTRGALLDAGRSEGIPVVEALLPLDAAMTELYATSTLKELAPVVTLDGRPAPGAGPLGDALCAAYRRLVEREST